MEYNMEEDDHSSSSEEEEDEEEWFDYLVRRPDDVDLQRRSEEQLPAPTKVITSTYRKARLNGSDIELILRGYEEDSDESMVSTGLIEWHASDVLCEYLLNSDEIKNGNSIRLLELGSGLGKCGLLLHLLLQSNGRSESTVLTDGDTNVMQLLRKNVAFNTFSNDNDDISCQQLKWGTNEAKSFLSKQDYNQKFDLIIGSDLLYTNRQNLNPLFETIDVLLDDRHYLAYSSRGYSRKFILAHNEDYSIPVKSVVTAASRKDLFCEVVKQAGEVSVLCFRRSDPLSMNKVVDELQAKIMMLGTENRRQKARMEIVEDKCLKLDKRCTVLRGDKDLPTSHKTLLLLDQPVSSLAPRHIK